MSQFSLFGAAAAEPALDDLDGALLAGGRWTRQAGTARLSVVVAERWRADALAAEFAARGVTARDGAAGDGAAGDGAAGGGGTGAAVVPADTGWSARTAFTAQLADAAARWARGANDGPPVGFTLTGGGLRLWALAGGSADDTGYLLRTERADTALHLAAGAQLSRLGVAAASLTHRGGPGWRVTSAKRIRRLAELLGQAPPGGAQHWPRPPG